MTSPDRQQRIAALRDSIADIERKPALAAARSQARGERAGFPMPASGLVQEIFTDERRNGGAVLGFALGQARSLITRRRPAVVYLQLLAEAQEMGMPYGPGLSSLGFAADALVLVRAANMTELLWAAEEALACRAVAAVVADIAGTHKLLDFTASRRLSMRTASAGSSMFLLRYGRAREASAAQLRWRLTPHPSARQRFDALAPGAPRWRAQLEKGVSHISQTEWLLGWTKDGFTTLNTARAHAARPAAVAPLSGAVSAQLAHRLPETG